MQSKRERYLYTMQNSISNPSLSLSLKYMNSISTAPVIPKNVESWVLPPHMKNWEQGHMTKQLPNVTTYKYCAPGSNNFPLIY